VVIRDDDPERAGRQLWQRPEHRRNHMGLNRHADGLTEPPSAAGRSGAETRPKGASPTVDV
jgi:hypothetical protein